MAKILEYDGVVIGAGHNGMICAAYLAKCGQKIMVVEKNMEVGGGLDSHEDRNYPGFWHNIHSVFHRGLMMLPWYKDLELENFGIHYYRPDPGVVHHFIDKTYLGWFSEVKKTVETIERFSKKDAARNDSGRARVSKIFRHHAGGVRAQAFRTPSGARLYRLSRRDARLRA